MNLYGKWLRKIPRRNKEHFVTKNPKMEKFLYNEFGLFWTQIFWGAVFFPGMISFLFVLVVILIELPPMYLFLPALIFIILYLHCIRLFPRYYRKLETQIDKNLPLIKSCIELYISILPKSYDTSLLIIEFLANVPSPIQKSFKQIQIKIQNGLLPEMVLQKYVSPSKSFNSYLQSLVQHNFSKTGLDIQHESTLEQKYQIKSHSLESRISISFFFGIFLPLGASFAIFLLNLEIYWVILSSPLLLFILHKLTQQIMVDNTLLLGTSSTSKKQIKTEYSEFFRFFYLLSQNLKHMCPERAVVHALHCTSIGKKKGLLHFLSQFKSHHLPFDDLLEKINLKIKGTKTQLIFGTLRFMLISNNMIRSQSIDDLLTVLIHHHHLETQRIYVIKGEIFKVQIFQILLPLVLGLLSGVLYSIISLVPNYILPFFTTLSKLDLMIFAVNQAISSSISIYFFRKMVGLKNAYFNIIMIAALYGVVFLLSILILQSWSFSF